MKKDSTLSLLLALVVLGRWDQFKKHLRLAAKEGLSLQEIQEILLQAHLFAGFPRTIEAFEILSTVQASGIFPNGHTKISAEPSLERSEQEKRGKELFDKIYAAKSDEVLSRIESFHPDLRTWILQHAYGRVLSRPLLSPKQRELAAVAALVVSRQWKQLMSHLRGALRCGATRDELTLIFEQLKPITPPTVLTKARKIFDQV